VQLFRQSSALFQKRPAEAASLTTLLLLTQLSLLLLGFSPEGVPSMLLSKRPVCRGRDVLSVFRYLNVFRYLMSRRPLLVSPRAHAQLLPNLRHVVPRRE
jgi:hypothetical protein